MKIGFVFVFLRIDSGELIRASRPDSRCEPLGHLSPRINVPQDRALLGSQRKNPANSHRVIEQTSQAFCLSGASRPGACATIPQCACAISTGMQAASKVTGKYRPINQEPVSVDVTSAVQKAMTGAQEKVRTRLSAPKRP